MLKLYIFLKRVALGALCLGYANLSISQVSQPREMLIKDLTSFKDPGGLWQVAGDVSADLKKANTFITTPGEGVIVNLPTKKKNSTDLFSSFEHGDIDLEFDFMIANGGNSGVYLQGRYEVQLLDSWNVKVPRSADNGGIYERWDESNPEGKKGYEGYAPRQNVSRAPGLWQNMKISFQAPVFDAKGNKIQNAQILKAELNGVVIHENVELTGPTRGAISNDEAVKGPLRIQGDHGAVAFKNIRIRFYDSKKPELKNLKYSLFKGLFQDISEINNVEPLMADISLSNKLAANFPFLGTKPFIARYYGKIAVAESGAYDFKVYFSRGATTQLKIDNKIVLQREGGSEAKAVQLQAGEYDFELLYAKQIDWGSPSIGMAISGPGFRDANFSAENVTSHREDPILVHADANMILKSFMDLPKSKKELFTNVYHATHVGSPLNVHYTYDNDHGSLVQVWRGGFLDATPMWSHRGDGSSRPLGSVIKVMPTALTINKLSSSGSSWKSDTTGTGFRSKGYVLDGNGLPAFKYIIYGMDVSDFSSVIDEGRGIRREIRLDNNAENIYARLAIGKSIQAVAKDMYAIDDKTYYLKLEDLNGSKPIIRDGEDGQKELIVPVSARVIYSIIF